MRALGAAAPRPRVACAAHGMDGDTVSASPSVHVTGRTDDVLVPWLGRRPAAGANSGDLGTRNQPTPDSISSIPGHPCALCILITRCNFRPASWIPMRRLLLRPRHNGKRFRTVLISKLGIMRKIGAFCFVLFLLFATATHPNS